MPLKRDIKRKATKAIAPYFVKKNHRGFNNRQRLFKDVAALKKMVNAEKQNADISSGTTFNFAQNAGLLTGAYITEIHPVIGQGSSEDQRKGDSLKVVSFCFQAEVKTNSFLTLSDVHYKIYLLRQPTNPSGVAGIATTFLEPNVFSGVVDYNSNRDYQNFKDYIVIGTINGVIRQNTNASVGQFRQNQHKIARKAEFHIRYNKGTTGILQNSMWAVCVADTGDTATTNYLTIQWTNKVYYYDN